jgi:hypothetical protein
MLAYSNGYIEASIPAYYIGYTYIGFHARLL